jgi:hypothetical protein
MLVNISKSLVPVQSLMTGAAYLFGIILIYNAFERLRTMMNSGRRSQEHMMIVVAYLLGGSGLLFLPSMVSVLANTFFGVNNVLQYVSFQNYGILGAIKIIIQTAGVIWFFRGMILLVHASEPGGEEGPRGLAMLVAGIFGIYFNETIQWMNSVVNLIMNHMTLTSITAPSS